MVRRDTVDSLHGVSGVTRRLNCTFPGGAASGFQGWLPSFRMPNEAEVHSDHESNHELFFIYVFPHTVVLFRQVIVGTDIGQSERKKVQRMQLVPP